MTSRAMLLMTVGAAAVLAAGCDAHRTSGPPPGGFVARTRAAVRETEAQWTADDARFRRLYAALVQGGYAGLHAAPLWGDMSPRKYVDAYYDTADGALARGSQTFRHRQRFAPLAPIAIIDGVEALGADAWKAASDSIQYKGAPIRWGVTVSRLKRGDVKLTHAQALAALGCRSEPFAPDDDPFALLRKEHPGVGCGDLVVQRRMVQYRMHFVLWETDPAKPLYHVSLDRVGSLEADGRPSGSMAMVVELEATRAWIVSSGEAAFAGYARLARELEAEFGLKPMSSSKQAIAAEVSRERE